jgi:hypothetical protein
MPVNLLSKGRFYQTRFFARSAINIVPAATDHPREVDVRLVTPSLLSLQKTSDVGDNQISEMEWPVYTILRPRIIGQAIVVGERPNGQVASSPFDASATMPSPLFRQPKAEELPQQMSATLPQFDWKQMVRYEPTPLPSGLDG